MLTAFLHRKRITAKALEQSGLSIESTRQVFGTRLLVRGLLWGSVYLFSRGLLELGIDSPAARVMIALIPTPFFIWYLWTWMQGVSRMDELQRRIELEALGFAFPAAVVFLGTAGLLDVALTLDGDEVSLRHTWLMLPMLYYVGLWRAKKRYQ